MNGGPCGQAKIESGDCCCHLLLVEEVVDRGPRGLLLGGVRKAVDGGGLSFVVVAVESRPLISLALVAVEPLLYRRGGAVLAVFGLIGEWRSAPRRQSQPEHLLPHHLLHHPGVPDAARIAQPAHTSTALGRCGIAQTLGLGLGSTYVDTPSGPRLHWADERKRVDGSAHSQQSTTTRGEAHLCLSCRTRGKPCRASCGWTACAS